MSKMYQVDLKEAVIDGVHARRQMTTWVPTDTRISVGSNITLRNSSIIWRVERIYDQNVQDFNEVVSNRGFDNNNYDHHKGLGIKQ